MLSIEVKNNLGAMLFDSAFPKNDFETREQKTNADGVPLWQISVILRQADARRSENITVTVPSAKDPAEAIAPFSPIGFQGLRLMTGENNGRPWVSFHADAVGVVNANPAK